VKYIVNHKSSFNEASKILKQIDKSKVLFDVDFFNKSASDKSKLYPLLTASELELNKENEMAIRNFDIKSL